MRNLTVKLVIAIVLLLVAAPILAQPGPRPGHPHMGRMLDRLDLTSDQRERIEATIAQYHETLREKQQQVGESRRTVAQAVHAEEFDETAIRNAVAATAQLEADLAVERARGLHEMLELLTPEQREQARAMIESHGEKGFAGQRTRGAHGKRHHPRGGRPAPEDLDN